jgi:hypothetical protein
MTKALETSSPGFVVHLGSAYYAGIGKLWSKPDNGTQWSLHTVSGVAATQPFVSSGVVANVGGFKLFAAFVDSSTGDSLGVWSTANGSGWTRVDAAFPPAGTNLVNILAANNTVFAVTVNDRTLTTDPAVYSIYYFDGTIFTSAGILNDPTIGVPTSVAYDGSNYWMTAGDVVLKGLVTALAPAAPQPSGSDFSGVAVRNTSELIISSYTGNLYYSINNGTTWTTAGPFNNSKGKAYSLSAPTVVNDNILVVGTSSFPLSTTLPSYDGYLEFDVSGGFSAGMASVTDHSLISSAVDFDSSLTTRSVSSMPLVDFGDGTYKLFACTDSYGLWSNAYDGTNWGLWKRE